MTFLKTLCYRGHYFPRHTSDKVVLACRAVDSYQVFKINVKDKN